MNRWID